MKSEKDLNFSLEDRNGENLNFSFFIKWIVAKAFLIEINVNSVSNCGLGINLGFFLTAPVRPTLSFCRPSAKP